jgi:hypothetical protein
MFCSNIIFTLEKISPICNVLKSHITNKVSQTGFYSYILCTLKKKFRTRNMTIVSTKNFMNLLFLFWTKVFYSTLWMIHIQKMNGLRFSINNRIEYCVTNKESIRRSIHFVSVQKLKVRSMKIFHLGINQVRAFQLFSLARIKRCLFDF